jgi:peptidyl-prolyl cis-trans isomerase B (cyclophilin B)
MIALTTNHGRILIELRPDKAPKTCENFLRYVRDGFYDGTLFHRVIDGFMIQGGGFHQGMVQKATREPIANEANNGLGNRVGSIAMARTSAPHSATAQFFINVADNSFLDHPGQDGWGYCVFGQVVEGMDVVERIRCVPTARMYGYQDVPEPHVIIEKAEVID